MKYEYKVVPAPKKASKVKGLKRGEDRFAASLAALMNEYGAEGWEYQRTDTLPVEARAGLTSRTTVFQNMLIFRRTVEEDTADASRGEAAKPAPGPAEPAATTPAEVAEPQRGVVPVAPTALPSNVTELDPPEPKLEAAAEQG